MKNLVITRVGGRSLHPSWLDAGRPRNWDLYVSPYQPIAPAAGTGCIVGDVIPGPKWSGICEVLDRWDRWHEYDQVWLPDDDILVGQDDVNEMFEVASAVGLDLFAPALDDQSYFAHFITRRNPRFHGRWVGFVEIMVPGFSTSALERLRPTLDLSVTGWGWGLDSVWPKLLGYENVGIIDGITVTHTRPVGEMRDAELRQRVLAESDAMLARYDCRQEHTTFGGFGPDLEPLELTAEQLLLELVHGYQPLWEADPRVLSWIAEFQGRRFPPPAYPVEGTP